MRRGGIEVEVRLLDVLAVVAFGPGETEEPLLQDGIAAVPQGEREAQALLAIADPEQAVFTPPVGTAARVIVREVLPGGAVRGVVLAHRPPLPLREIGPPALPVPLAARVLVEPPAFGPHRHGLTSITRPHRGSAGANSQEGAAVHVARLLRS